MTPGAIVPLVSVVLPVFNGEAHIGDAVQSVLAQTFTDFQLLVIDDGSTDDTARVLSGFADSRLRVIPLAGHQGLVAALNRGVRESGAAFIARMDADDVCLPRRLERQVAFLKTHPDIDVCGTWTRDIGERHGARRLPVDPEHVHARLFFGGATDHPTVMMRRAFVEANRLAYREDFACAEDLDLLTRAADVGRLANVPEILLLYRAHPQQVSVVRSAAQASTHARIALRQLRALVPGADEDEAEFHVRLVLGQTHAPERPRAERWLRRLDQANRVAGRYDAAAFLGELRRLWFRIHDRAGQRGSGTLREYWSSPLSGVRDIGVLRHARFVARSVNLS